MIVSSITLEKGKLEELLSTEYPVFDGAVAYDVEIKQHSVLIKLKEKELHFVDKFKKQLHNKEEI